MYLFSNNVSYTKNYFDTKNRVICLQISFNNNNHELKSSNIIIQEETFVDLEKHLIMLTGIPFPVFWAKYKSITECED